MCNLAEKLLKKQIEINSCGVDEAEHMLQLFMQYLTVQFDTTQIIWSAFYRGDYGRDNWYTSFMDDWKVIDIHLPMHEKDVSDVPDRLIAAKNYYKLANEKGGLDPQIVLAVENAGSTRAHLLKDAISEDEWENHWMRKNLAKAGIGERMVGSFALSDKAESVFSIDRGLNKPPFTIEDKTKLVRALLLFPRMHFWLMLSKGILEPAKKPLTPREQMVLKMLITPKTESQIAEELSLAKGTVHNYVTDIYRNFSVHSRYQLMQLFFGRIDHY